MKHRSLYICYYHLSEPLVETQVIAYLRELARRGTEVHLLTFERGTMTAEKAHQEEKRLAEAGIRWYTLPYHSWPSLPATIYDIVAGIIKARRICRRHKIEVVHARSHVPAAMALALKRLFGYRFLFDFRGMLAEEYVDGGHWREGGLKFRLTKRLERAFFRESDALVMLTARIKRELVRDEPELRLRAGDIQVIPCCVETSRFAISSSERTAYRCERGWQNRIVLTYVGKIGLWYLMDEMVSFFATAREREPRFFFQILTQSEVEPLRADLARRGVPEESYDIRFASPERLPLMLSASDAGISLIRACNSKRASSPTKVGEYLAAGLPVVINSGVGDCDEIIEGNRLGVVVHDFSEDGMRRASDELISLLEESDIRERCQRYAERELSLAQVGGPRYTAVYERLMGGSESKIAKSAAEPA